ncbi:transposase [Kitasatospora sp. MAA4]|nr:transposase [Kitasatospora sp. MAA4]
MRERRYPSDTTDAEWALIEPLLPVPACRTAMGGRPEAHPRRDVVDAIRYVVDNGAKWRALPSDFPPWRTVFGFFDRWAKAGVVERIRDALRTRLRVDAGKIPNQVTVIVDSQSVKAAETVSKATRGYDAGKKINGRKRHIAVDSLGLLVTVVVTAADVSERDAARVLLWRLRKIHPQLTLVWGDGAYSGSLIDWART